MKFLSLFKKDIKRYKDVWILIILVLGFIFLRMPSLVEPYWYGDEGIYQVVGKAINSGRILYQDIWDNKPPLLYYIYAVFNGEQFFVRLFSLIIGAFSVIAFYFLAQELFKKRKSIVISTLFYVILFGTPIIEGNIANAENFMHLPIIISAIFLLKFKKERKYKFIFLSGLLLSIALTLKAVAVFEFIAFGLFLITFGNSDFLSGKLGNLFKFKKIKNESLFLLGFLIFPILFSFYFILLNAFPDFLSGVLSENIDYVGAENDLVFPMGILLIKILIAVSLTIFVLLKRKKFSDANLFIYLWLILALFSTFFSQRPYLHYMLMTALPLSYFVGSIVDSSKQRVIKISIVLVILVVFYLNFGIYKKTISYYQNYINFLIFNEKVDKYQSFFDSNTPRDYELARFIETFSEKENDVFLWSDSGQIYALSDSLPPGKYIVAYHITYYNNAIGYMVEKISEQQPKYIIKTKDSPEFRNFLSSYVLKYRIADSDIYERQN